MKPPDVVIIGMRRSGTTSMYNYLAQHPKVHLAQGGPKQEIHFCDREKNWARGPDWYYDFFDGEVAIEKSPTYMQVPYAAERLKEVAPDARLLVMLRHPITRAYSDWAKRVAERREKRSWEQAVKDEIENSCDDWEGDFDHSRAHLFGYLARSRYTELLEPWWEAWGSGPLLLIQYEYFALHVQDVMWSAFRWCGVKPIKVNASQHWQRQFYPEMSRKTYELARGYLEPIPKAQDIPFGIGIVEWEI